MDTKLFDDWNVQLAKTYKPGLIKPDTWFTITEKINGVRATSYGGYLVSRTGHQILGVQHIIDDIIALNKELGGAYSFDGELRLADVYCQHLSDNEAFKQTVGLCNTQRDTKEKIKLQFIIFDVIKTRDFAFEQPTETYSERLQLLQEIGRIIFKNGLIHLKLVPIYYEGTDIAEIEHFSNYMYQMGKEGIMINLDAPYQYKRSNKLLKYKQFNTIDLKVIGSIEGSGKYTNMLGALICSYNGNVVYVGSGFTDEQRYYLWEHKDTLYGRIAEVKYKDITSDATTGLKSLQFPVFVQFRTDKENPDA